MATIDSGRLTTIADTDQLVRSTKEALRATSFKIDLSNWQDGETVNIDIKTEVARLTDDIAKAFREVYGGRPATVNLRWLKRTLLGAEQAAAEWKLSAPLESIELFFPAIAKQEVFIRARRSGLVGDWELRDR